MSFTAPENRISLMEAIEQRHSVRQYLDKPLPAAVIAELADAVFACNAESKADMIHKLSIAQKECKETMYWLKVLHGSEFINTTYYEELMGDVEELYRVLTASIKTAKSKL